MSDNLQTIKDIRNHLINELHDIYPEKEIIAITNHIFKTQFDVDRLHLITEPGRTITPGMSAKIIQICDELKTGKPIQYILGELLFYDCKIKVSYETLIPRPETEELVDMIIKENKEFRGRIIDLGTGSGCIAIALSKNLPHADVTGIDISEGAIKIAKSNARVNNTNVKFVRGDVFHFDIHSVTGADIIVSNPPYVLESEKKNINRNVIDFEPHQALFVPDNDPLKFYKAISRIAVDLLSRGGRIYCEINGKKGVETSDLLRLAGFNNVLVINDLNGKNRFVKGIFNG